ncbi:MAG: transposase domain-containing protein [Chitinophagaceae bacterium]|nr:transposase domain-containing protein [Chitinophagaceae bacterium]
MQLITDSFIGLHYTLKNFKALSAYTSNGMLPIDDNELEGQIRTIAPERYNYSFAGSHRAGEPAAVLYSLIATCKLQYIDPSEWLDDLLRRIPT